MVNEVIGGELEKCSDLESSLIYMQPDKEHTELNKLLLNAWQEDEVKKWPNKG